jgi:hypothetical protein
MIIATTDSPRRYDPTGIFLIHYLVDSFGNFEFFTNCRHQAMVIHRLCSDFFAYNFH